MSFQKIFLDKSIKNPKGIFSFLDINELFKKSFLINQTKIQRSDLYRASCLSRAIANFIIDDDGVLILDRIDYCIDKAKESSYVLFEDNQSDAFFTKHLVQALKKISKSNSLIKKIKRLKLPLCHKKAEDIIRQTLLLNADEPITNRDVKRAFLCALFTFLRQSVGSCFATSCAIYTQKLDLEKVFEDIEELIKTGSLTRTILGVKYLVPFNPSIGMGDLKRTLTKSQFEIILKSPIILDAFERAEIISLKLTQKEKEKKLTELVSKVTEKKQISTLYDLIDSILLNVFELTDRDFFAKKWEEKTERFVASSFHPQINQPSKSYKKDKVETYLEKKQIFLDVFRNEVECALLKCWEFTLASLCDVKREFTLWNLYYSLGLSNKESDGIGAFLYKLIDEKLQKTNIEAHKYHQQADEIESQVRATETVLYRTQIPSEESRMRTELNLLVTKLQEVSENRDLLDKKVEGYQNLYKHFIESYVKLFETYFQEVYDPEMLEFPTLDYNDSPAGFRLIYTHGRKDPSNWSFIKDKDEFIQALRDFFTVTEREIVSSFFQYDLQIEIADIITEMIQDVLSPVFIDSCMKRVQSTHASLLSHVEKSFKEKIIQKPWAYISGGTLETLVKTYFKKENLQIVEQEILSPEMLFAFLVDTIRDIDFPLKGEIIDNKLNLLLYSTSHACVLCPNIPSFKNAWYTEEIPESILQTHLFAPAEEFVTKIILDEERQKDLLETLLISHPEKKKILSSYIPVTQLSVINFKEHLSSYVSISSENIDSFLFTALLHPLYDIDKIFSYLSFENSQIRQKAKKIYQQNSLQVPLNFLTLRKEIFKSLIEVYDSVCMPFDYHKELIDILQKEGWVYPRPILFADTNWPCYYFGFLPSPTSLQLELWRFDTLSVTGYKMEKGYFDQGTKWGVIADQLIYGN